MKRTFAAVLALVTVVSLGAIFAASSGAGADLTTTAEGGGVTGEHGGSFSWD